jgi:hypothetical protein
MNNSSKLIKKIPVDNQRGFQNNYNSFKFRWNLTSHANIQNENDDSKINTVVPSDSERTSADFPIQKDNHYLANTLSRHPFLETHSSRFVSPEISEYLHEQKPPILLNLERTSLVEKPGYNRMISLGVLRSFYTPEISDYTDGDTITETGRSLATTICANLSFSPLRNKNIFFSTGFNYRYTSETRTSLHNEWETIVEVVLIDGEPVTIVYEDWVSIRTTKNYFYHNYMLPISLGYNLPATNHLNFSFAIGGRFVLTAVREHITEINSVSFNVNNSQTALSFSPNTRFGVNYFFGQLGVGMEMEYSFLNFRDISFFKNGYSWQEINFGASVLYRF